MAPKAAATPAVGSLISLLLGIFPGLEGNPLGKRRETPGTTTVCLPSGIRQGVSGEGWRSRVPRGFPRAFPENPSGNGKRHLVDAPRTGVSHLKSDSLVAATGQGATRLPVIRLMGLN